MDDVKARCDIKTRNYVKSLTNSRTVLFLASKSSSIHRLRRLLIILTEFLLLARLFVPAKCTAGVNDKTFVFLLPILILRHTKVSISLCNSFCQFLCVNRA